MMTKIDPSQQENVTHQHIAIHQNKERINGRNVKNGKRIIKAK